MKEIILKYSYKKIILAVFFYILMIAFFLYLFMNANELSLINPNESYSRYRWVGHLFYKNKTLLSITSLLFLLLFSYVFMITSSLFFRKGLIIKKEFNDVYFNNKKIESLQNIKKIERVGKHFIYFYFDERIKQNSFSFKKNKYAFNISFFDKKSDEIYFLIKKLIK
jgi:hypothetical protein